MCLLDRRGHALYFIFCEHRCLLIDTEAQSPWGADGRKERETEQNRKGMRNKQDEAEKGPTSHGRAWFGWGPVRQSMYSYSSIYFLISLFLLPPSFLPTSSYLVSVGLFFLSSCTHLNRACFLDEQRLSSCMGFWRRSIRSSNGIFLPF
mmetsp:Transcript_13259/g.26148  ORF Transcript_13259/g.26148 Transcript_13259/m.26148 type:complete len:149 (+) Transcript_13259:1845-2291(+)